MCLGSCFGDTRNVFVSTFFHNLRIFSFRRRRRADCADFLVWKRAPGGTLPVADHESWRNVRVTNQKKWWCWLERWKLNPLITDRCWFGISNKSLDITCGRKIDWCNQQALGSSWFFISISYYCWHKLRIEQALQTKSSAGFWPQPDWLFDGLDKRSHFQHILSISTTE